MQNIILFFPALLCVFLSAANAENILWNNLSETSNKLSNNVAGVATFQLDADRFKQTILTQAKNIQVDDLLIDIPLPSGEVVAFRTEPYSFEASPSADFQAWKVTSVSEPFITGVIDYSSIGFHATLFMPDGEVVTIDPQDRLGDSQQYAVKPRSASHKDKGFSCTLHDHGHTESLAKTINQQVTQRPARGLKTYRLAMAATRQYTSFFGGENNALNAIRATVNRVNAIYARDLELQLILVSGTNLIFSNATNPYPYIEGVSSNPLLDQNTDVINSIIGSVAYDIGHVVSQGGGGGIAGLASVCSVDRKGAGFTSRVQPQGDAFDIDFVAHEIGHQLGATHTFNSTTESCAGRNRSAQTAYEPGSGTSIMAYAGICGLNNLQLNSDAMFHIGSIEQIDENIRNGSGASCGNVVGTSNSAPDINLSVVANNVTTVVAGQSFTLTGAATDVDAGQTLSYNWDQFDAGTATDAFVDAGDNALYRSTLPSASPTRTFPGYTTKNRTLTFKFVVRDGNGGVSSTPVSINVVGGESFNTPTTSTNAPQLPLELGSNTSNSGGGGAIVKLLMLFGILWGIGLIRKIK